MTAHDPRVTLTETEGRQVREAIKARALDRFLHDSHTEDARDWLAGFAARAAIEVFDDLLAARLAPIRALAERWEQADTWEGEPAMVERAFGQALRAALDGAEGQGEGE